MIKIIKNRCNDDEKISILVVIMLISNIVTLTLNTLVNLFLVNTPFENTPFDTIFIYGVIFVVALYCLDAFIRRISVYDIIIFIVVAIIFSLNIIVFPQNSSLIFEVMPRFFITVLPLFFLGKMIRDYDLMLKYLRIATIILTVSGVIYYFIMIVIYKSSNYDHMSFAYYFLPCCILNFYFLSKKLSIANITLTAASVCILVLTGTRGPLLCLAIAILMIIFFVEKRLWVKLLWVTIILCGVLFFLSPMYVEFLNYLSDLFKQIGVQNRIVDKLLSQEFADGSGRDVLYETIVRAIDLKPLSGYGIMGDRILTLGVLKYDGYTMTYVHNFFLEMFCHYGVILGGMFILSSITLIILVLLKKDKSDSFKILFTLFMCIGFFKLFLSGSYLYEGMFFMCLGIMVGALKKPIEHIDEIEHSEKIEELTP